MSARGRWIAGSLVAALLLVAAFFLGFITPGLRMPGDNSAEAGFARDMSRHHAQAVSMSMTEWQKGNDVEVKQLAFNIATTQQAQIGMMSTWLQQWHLSPTGSQPAMAWMGEADEVKDGLMPGMATTAQMNQLTESSGKALDILFCQLMLRHHLGGIHMAEAVLARTHNGQVRDLAQSMVDGQQFDVIELRALLTKLGAQPLP